MDRKNGTRSAQNESRWVMPIVYINIILYALCYQLQRPIEPFLVDRLVKQQKLNVDVGEGDIMASYGRLQSFFSLLQTFGSPFVGFLLDRIGSRNCFVVVFLSSALSYWLLAQANSMSMLYLSKIPTIFQAAFLVAQAIVATSLSQCNSADRAAALGRLTTSYTLGATIGPALGGILGVSGDYFFGAKLAVAGSLISVGLALLLPSKAVDMDKEKVKQLSSTKRGSLFKATFAVLRKPIVWRLLVIKVFSSVTNSMINTSIPILLKQHGFNEADLGWNMSSSFVAVAVMGGTLMKPLTSQLGAFRLTYFSLMSKAAFGVSFAFLTLTQGWLIITIVSIALACSAHVLATAVTLRTTGSVDASEQGTLLGIEHSLFALARVFGPSIGMRLMASYGFKTVALVCCFVDLCLATFGMTFSNETFKNNIMDTGKGPMTPANDRKYS